MPRTPCQQCIDEWGQEPSPWGDSVAELDAYRAHETEHVHGTDDKD